MLKNSNHFHNSCLNSQMHNSLAWRQDLAKHGHEGVCNERLLDNTTWALRKVNFIAQQWNSLYLILDINSKRVLLKEQTNQSKIFTMFKL